MLVHAQEKLRVWRAELLGAGGVVRSEARATWASRVAELHTSLEEIAEVADGVARIIHHFDVFHVEVKVVESLTAFINDSTKQIRPSKKTALKEKAAWELRGEPLNNALKQAAEQLRPEELRLLGAASAEVLQNMDIKKIKGALFEKQDMLRRLATPDFMQVDEPAEAEGEAEAEAEAGGASGTGLSEDEKEAEAQRKADNRDRLAGRKQLLDAQAGLLDTVRHHFYRCAMFAAMLVKAGKPVEEVQGAAWELWMRGLIGHVVQLTHEFCGPSAECKQEGYKNRAPLSRVARSLFLQFVMEPKIKELIFKCIWNGHTWHCESLSNLAHMYQPKRIVYSAARPPLPLQLPTLVSLSDHPQPLQVQSEPEEPDDAGKA